MTLIPTGTTTTIRQRGKQNGTILQRNMELMSINMVTTSSMEMKIATLVSKMMSHKAIVMRKVSLKEQHSPTQR